jgi:uncharacterized protein YuzE
MKLSYDLPHNIAYLHLHEKTAQFETLCPRDEVNVDIAPDGTVYGVELLNANQQLRGEDHGNLGIVNEAIGERREVPLE